MRTFVFISVLFFICAIPATTLAQEIDSNSVKLEIEDIRYEEPTPVPQLNSTDTVLYGKDMEEYYKHGYVIYTDLNEGLSFNVSGNRVNIEPQQMNTVVEKSISLAVSSETAFSYEMLAVQQRTLSTSNGSAIENTVCDFSFLPCTSTLARSWKSNGSYGFGYRLKGDDSSSEFNVDANYRPFPLNSKKELPIRIMNNFNVSGTRQNEVFLKTLFPPTYQEGTYIGDISVITLPSL